MTNASARETYFFFTSENLQIFWSIKAPFYASLFRTTWLNGLFFILGVVVLLFSASFILKLWFFVFSLFYGFLVAVG